MLRTRADVTVVAGVDPHVPSAPDLPVYPSIAEALADRVRPGLAVVATPTDTHLDLVRELLDGTEARVLSEKPLARSAADLAAFVDAYPPDVLADRLAVSHHFAFSPEVEWARDLVAGHPAWGPPTRVTCVFNDAYGGFGPERRAVYVSSWVDSGPNQLSVLAAFVPAWTVRTHRDETTRAVTALDLGAGAAHLVSNWGAADSSKQTSLEYLGGEVEIRLDHTSMTALVRERDAVVGHTAYTGTVGRKHAHYRGVYDAVLADSVDDRLGLALAARIAETLELAGRAPAADVALGSVG